LRFSPTAWAKLLFLRDVGTTEIGAFGITPLDDLLYVEDVRLVRQTCDWAHVAFDDEAVANFFDEQVDQGRQPQQFGRIWVHTHPGHSAQPSGVDEETFQRVFGRSDWAVMFILARDGDCFARLRCNVGPGAEIELPVDVDYSRPFGASEVERWGEEYLANVQPPAPKPLTPVDDRRPALIDRNAQSCDDTFVDEWWRDVWSDYTEFDRYPEENRYGFMRDF
jgi:proteasome lid subunit RPN8/RPN11